MVAHKSDDRVVSESCQLERFQYPGAQECMAREVVDALAGDTGMDQYKIDKIEERLKINLPQDMKNILKIY